MSRKPTRATYAAAFGALIALTALTFGLSYLRLGALEMPVSLAIAAAKAIVVALFFMHLIEQPASHRIAVVTAVLLLAILISLASADVVTRT